MFGSEADSFVGCVWVFLRFFSWIGGTRGRRFLQKAGKKMIGLLQDQRRAQRLPIYLPVQVFWQLDGVPFSEATETINVSACGGLVPISAGGRARAKINFDESANEPGSALPRRAPDSQRTRSAAGGPGISAIRAGILALLSRHR